MSVASRMQDLFFSQRFRMILQRVDGGEVVDVGFVDPGKWRFAGDEARLSGEFSFEGYERFDQVVLADGSGVVEVDRFAERLTLPPGAVFEHTFSVRVGELS